ncbi:MAG: N-acetylneuraminate synthase [Flavisolibacter sp.]|nr:N-acetylneuraminate synthase [Flavisolibacter sp.]
MRNKTLIIAEAGVNHNGDMQLAKQLIDTAAEAGADIVKFQTFVSKNLVSKSAEKAAYQKATTAAIESQLEMLQRLELTEADHHILIAHCKSKGIEFLSTPFDLESIELLKKLGISTGKIPSGEITNLPYLRQMAAAFSTIILSTGMSTMQEIGDALKVLTDCGTVKENITVLHCNTEYPTPMVDVNLLAMDSIKKEFNVKVGYSDHTEGIEVPVAAVALGAEIIEKHFTLDRNMEGPDHKASLEPNELKALVRAVRNIELAVSGSGLKVPSASEMKNKEVGRKSIVAAKEIKQGEAFSEDNLTTKRPGTGISPMRWDEIIGLEAQRDYSIDDLISI